MQTGFNRFLYAGFILLGAYYAFRGDIMQLAATWGIAFAFDPIDPKQPWKERKWWQRAVLLFQLSVVLLALIGSNWITIKSGITDGWMGK